ncbi:hypothetical protein [Streptacidiphilus melanogenes]|uniref:hypothetical protein n=1 Tax=Streptacidiphilus melanogenes TaxID=411235 RepID=UPI00126A3F0D|nr:hypothetical protein [Streptacidiphilus melanogenes]
MGGVVELVAGELVLELGCVVAVVGVDVGVAAVDGGAVGVVRGARGAAGRTEACRVPAWVPAGATACVLEAATERP